MPISGPPLDGPVRLHEILKTGLEPEAGCRSAGFVPQAVDLADLDDASTRLAGGYLGLGLAPGDRIASLMPNRTELLVHYLACMKCGLVAMPLNYRYMAPEIDHALGSAARRSCWPMNNAAATRRKAGLPASLPLGQISYGDESREREGELPFAGR